eukprot:CAMPEP_0114271160 /NCGR_PEP_ID=MMETSP0058-20121206/27689_1 /TAXON_ID=36894 /ORGANISM="Pyramimonas parkeae, CCMP726" /LENGTH=94 /DNA_ID=CAMNT_0001390077 /DNA_START=1674 /DNA_END=1958 /DNA_ORIENTATION=+
MATTNIRDHEALEYSVHNTGKHVVVRIRILPTCTLSEVQTDLVGKSTLEVCVARKHISIPLFVEVSGSEYTCKLRRKALPPHLEIAMARQFDLI